MFLRDISRRRAAPPSIRIISRWLWFGAAFVRFTLFACFTCSRRFHFNGLAAIRHGSENRRAYDDPFFRRGSGLRAWHAASSHVDCLAADAAEDGADAKEPARVHVVRRVVERIRVRLPRQRLDRIAAHELPRRRVVEAGPQVLQAGLGVGVLAGEAERRRRRPRAFFQRPVGRVGEGAGGFARGVGQQARGAELVVVDVGRRFAFDLLDRQPVWAVDVAALAVAEQQAERIALALRLPRSWRGPRRWWRPSGACGRCRPRARSQRSGPSPQPRFPLPTF